MTNDHDVGLVIEWLRTNVGIIVQDKNLQNFKSRLQVFKNQHGIDTSLQILTKLQQSSGEAFRTNFINQFTTNYTYFFREPRVLDYFSQEILNGHRSNPKLRIWSCACSTGQEAYTISIMIDNSAYRGDAKILATDVDSNALMVANQGVYSTVEANSIPEKFRVNSIEHSDQVATIREHIKKRITFRRLNLLDKPWPMKNKFDVIFCTKRTLLFFTRSKSGII